MAFDVDAPAFVGSADPREPIILLNIAREWDPALSAEQLHERTMRYWFCDPDRHKPAYAMAVAGGIVREVYRVTGWRAVAMIATHLDPTRKRAGASLPPRTDRKAFEGDVAPEMQHYRGKSVRHLLAQNPVRWLNC